MSKRRMVGWQPLAVENLDAPLQATSTVAEPEAVAPAPAEQLREEPPIAAAPAGTAHNSRDQAQGAATEPAPAPSGPVQDERIPRRRMTGWQPLSVANPVAPAVAQATAAPASAPTAEQTPVQAATTETAATVVPTVEEPAASSQAVAASGPIQDPDIPRRRMAGWQPLTVAHDAPAGVPTQAPTATTPVAETTTPAPEQPTSVAPAAHAAPAQPVAPAPVTEDLPRRRMDGWAPLQVGHPDSVASGAAESAASPVEPTPAAEPTPAPVAETAPAAPRRRMGAPAPSPAAASTPAPRHPEATTPDVVTPTPSKPAAQQPAASSAAKTAPKKELSKTAKVVLTLLGVAVVAAGLVVLAQWLRTLDPVAEFIAIYDGTPTHPDGVEAGIPAWVGWQHFFNFFIIVMVIRSGLLIRNQERPEAYWTPTEGGFYSPNKKNTPAKVSIQQWIHQSFNVLWVVNGLVFYIMVFATGHWMRIVPSNWDIFPNIVSAGVQYLSLDWPAENSWVYYNALQIMTYFITVFIAAPIAVLTGLRLSTWWPQKAEGLNKAFPLPVARTIHFITMVYFILFIIVHLFLVFTTGVLTNLNMMFTARDASDWWGIGVFALSVAVTVGVAWLIKPLFIAPIAEKTGRVSTR